MGEAKEIKLPGLDDAASERFRAKARHYPCQQLDHPVVKKVRHNEPLTAQDLIDLEHLLLQAGVGTIGDLLQACETAENFGVFLRSLTGMDRHAAKAAMDRFLYGKRPTANQLQFINHIIDHLTEEGLPKPELLYESPYTDLHPQGVEGIFPSAEVDELIAVLNRIHATASAASA